ncbi:hypothetical protein LCGC14_2788460, partial [marine sediment metagenome]
PDPLEKFHERDSEGRCLACLRYGEKVRLIEQAQKVSDPEDSRVSLMQLERL